MNEPISMDERQMSALEKELQEQRAPSASAPAETACQPRSLALATCSGSVSRAEVERDDLSDQADECEQIALFLARIGDKKKALQRLREAEELRRQVEAIDKRQPSPNAKAEGAAEAPAAKQSP